MRVMVGDVGRAAVGDIARRTGVPDSDGERERSPRVEARDVTLTEAFDRLSWSSSRCLDRSRSRSADCSRFEFARARELLVGAACEGVAVGVALTSKLDLRAERSGREGLSGTVDVCASFGKLVVLALRVDVVPRLGCRMRIRLLELATALGDNGGRDWRSATGGVGEAVRC